MQFSTPQPFDMRTTSARNDSMIRSCASKRVRMVFHSSAASEPITPAKLKNTVKTQSTGMLTCLG